MLQNDRWGDHGGVSWHTDYTCQRWIIKNVLTTLYWYNYWINCWCAGYKNCNHPSIIMCYYDKYWNSRKWDMRTCLDVKSIVNTPDMRLRYPILVYSWFWTSRSDMSVSMILHPVSQNGPREIKAVWPNVWKMEVCVAFEGGVTRMWENPVIQCEWLWLWCRLVTWQLYY